MAAALQLLPPPRGEPGQHHYRDQGALLPKRTLGVLQSVVALVRRVLRNFAAAQHQHQHQHHHQQQEQDGGDGGGNHLPAHGHGQASASVADQARVLVPLLLLLLHRGLLPRARPPRTPTTTTTTVVRHAPAAVLALAGDVLDLLLLQQPGTGLLPGGLGLRLPQQALGLTEAVGVVAAPAAVRDRLARAALALVVRDAEAAAATATTTGGEDDEAAPDAVASLVEWMATHTAGLLLQLQPSDGDSSQQALVTAAGAGRLALRLLERHGPPVASRLCDEQQRFWPWTPAGLLSCPAFLPGSLGMGSSDAVRAAQTEAKRAWVAVGLYLLERKRGGLGAFVGELRATLMNERAAVAVAVVDVVASATRALLGEEGDDDDQGRIEALQRETRAALAPFVRSAPAALSPVGGGAGGEKTKKRLSSSSSAGKEKEEEQGCISSKKQKRKK